MLLQTFSPPKSLTGIHHETPQWAGPLQHNVYPQLWYQPATPVYPKMNTLDHAQFFVANL